MLIPRAHAWTRRQRRIIAAMSVFALLVCGALILCYERYYRGAGEELLYGTWKGGLDWHGSEAWFEFRADHTFSIWDRAWFAKADAKPEFVTKGRWYAGGKFIYLRYSSKFRPDGNIVEFWHIDDITPEELRMRYWHDGGIHVFQRVDSVATRASNQALQRTASCTAIYLSSVCHPPMHCESRFTGLAVADLVSR